MSPDAVVIGGGAAGCFAAVTAARRGRNVLVLDGNDRLMHKLSITGKGRCNVTNDCGIDTLMQNVLRNPRFLWSAFSRCTPQDVMAFFEAEGVPLKTERGRRVFPVSDKAGDIVNALKNAMQRGGVQCETSRRVRKLCIENDVCTGVITANGSEIHAESVLIAAGGMSYPRTGSNGGGYKLAEQAGHTIMTPQPSLIPLETAEHDPQEMQGLSPKNVTLTVKRGKKIIFSEMGEMLFTHFGVSGPLILSASCLLDQQKIDEYTLIIDMKPALSAEQLDQRVQRDLLAEQNKAISNILRNLLPSSMIPVMLRRAAIDPQTQGNSVTKQQRRVLCEHVKQFQLHPTAMRPIAEAIVTRGGVRVKDVDPNTMESKLIRGLHFAGEVLDVDAFTGGYNLQIAFATGHAAGLHL